VSAISPSVDESLNGLTECTSKKKPLRQWLVLTIRSTLTHNHTLARSCSSGGILRHTSGSSGNICSTKSQSEANVKSTALQSTQIVAFKRPTPSPICGQLFGSLRILSIPPSFLTAGCPTLPTLLPSLSWPQSGWWQGFLGLKQAYCVHLSVIIEPDDPYLPLSAQPSPPSSRSLVPATAMMLVYPSQQLHLRNTKTLI